MGDCDLSFATAVIGSSTAITSSMMARHYFEHDGEALFGLACHHDLEGIVAKRNSDPYLTPCRITAAGSSSGSPRARPSMHDPGSQQWMLTPEFSESLPRHASTDQMPLLSFLRMVSRSPSAATQLRLERGEWVRFTFF